MKDKKIIYISGPITNDPDYEKHFNDAEDFLKLWFRNEKVKIINPIKGEKKGKSWKYYMIKDIKKLMKCNCIYLLPGWRESQGALLEMTIARAFSFNFLAMGD